MLRRAATPAQAPKPAMKRVTTRFGFVRTQEEKTENSSINKMRMAPATWTWCAVGLALAGVLPARGAEVATLAPETLKQTVFDDGQPWLIVCLSEARGGADPVHEVVGKAASTSAFPEDARIGVLDCRGNLPSGKTSFQRFKLDTKLEPVLFVVSGGDVTQVQPDDLQKHVPKPTAKAPRELFASARTHARALAALVAKLAAPHISRLTSDKELRSCTRRRACAVVLTSDDPTTSQQRLIDALARRFRHVHFGLLHLGRYEFSLESKLPAKPTRTEPRVLLLKATGGGGQGKRSETSALGARTHRGEWSEDSVGEFIKDALEGEQELVSLKKHPSLRWRSAKKPSASTTPSPPPSKRSGRGAGAARGGNVPDADAAARERERRRAMDREGEGLLFDDDDAEDSDESADEEDGHVEELVIDDDDHDGADDDADTSATIGGLADRDEL